MSDTGVRSSSEWTIGQLLDWTRGHFASRSVEAPRLCAEILLAAAMGCRRIDLYARFGELPTDAQRAQYREWVRRAAEHEPIAYLVGTREFYSLEFKVTTDVLIPRPETELLVEQALAWCEARSRDHDRLLDVGTGSGCIAITVAVRQPAAHVVATDLSPAALRVAADNAARHGVADRLTFIEADGLDLPAAVAGDRFDLLLSNPPYIPEARPDLVDRNVRDYEPHAALFVPGDGLDFYRRLAGGAAALLRPGGAIMVEVGYDQADAVAQVFAEAGGMVPVGRFKDLQGIERVLVFEATA